MTTYFMHLPEEIRSAILDLENAASQAEAARSHVAETENRIIELRGKLADLLGPFVIRPKVG